ncbi:hypothetical protein JZU51_01305 [bacterium]|nr:hypothetical protein [bacterium]
MTEPAAATNITQNSLQLNTSGGVTLSLRTLNAKPIAAVDAAQYQMEDAP